MSTVDSIENIASSELLWAPVSLLTKEVLNQSVSEIIQDNAKALVLNVNIHCMNLAYKHPWLRDMLKAAPIVFCDGAGVALALRLLGNVQVPERITLRRLDVGTR